MNNEIESTDLNGLTSKSLVIRVIESYQLLNRSEKHQYIELYIKKCQKNPLTYVTLGEHTQILKEVGCSCPINTEISMGRQENVIDSEVKSAVDESIKTDVQKPKEFEFKVPDINKLMKRKREQVVNGNIPNSEDVQANDGEDEPKKPKVVINCEDESKKPKVVMNL